MEGVRAFLRATYPTSTPAFKEAFNPILEGVGRDKLFQGPYLDPIRKAADRPKTRRSLRMNHSLKIK